MWLTRKEYNLLLGRIGALEADSAMIRRDLWEYASIPKDSKETWHVFWGSCARHKVMPVSHVLKSILGHLGLKICLAGPTQERIVLVEGKDD